MLRLITPILLIVISIAAFFTFLNPKYDEIQKVQAQIVAYNQALDNATSLARERDILINKSNQFNPNNIKKLERLLPDSVDSIRLIIEIQDIATNYGMYIKDVRYENVKKDSTSVVSAPVSTDTNQEFGTWNLEFSTEASYTDFLRFMKDLENNLRIVDITSISFSSTDNVSKDKTDYYKYSFKIKTYWLKN